MVVTVMATVDPPVTPMENICGCEANPEAVSVATIPKLNGLPVEDVAIPLMVPVAALSNSPGGREPEEIDQDRVAGLPPTAATVALNEAPTVPLGNVAGATYGLVCPLILETSKAELFTTSRSLRGIFLMHPRSSSFHRGSGTPLI